MKDANPEKCGGVYFVEDNDEEYLVYTPDDLLGYQRAMVDVLLPSDNKTLLEHLTHLMAFLDDVYQLFYQKEWLSLANDAAPLHRDDEEMGNDESSTSSSMTRQKKSRQHFNALFETYDAEADARQEAEEQRIAHILQSLSLGTINETVFRWHINVAQRCGPMTGLYATCYFMSWTAFARTFHLTIYSREEKLYHYTSKCAQTDVFCDLVMKREHVIVTTKEIIDYSVNDIWDSARIILPALYGYSFCRPMKDYVYALFFRYCDLLTVQQTSIETIFDNPLFIEESYGGNDETEEEEEEEEEEEDIDAMFDAFKRLRIESGAQYAIQTDFLFEGEMLFYYQLHRLYLSCRLQTLYESRALRLVYSGSTRRDEWLHAATKAWLDSMVSLARHDFLRPHVIEAFRNDLFEIQLYHGERECYRRKFPESMCEARDVLDDCRASVLQSVTETQRMTLQEMLSHSATAMIDSLARIDKTQLVTFEETLLDEGSDAWLAAPREKECLLLTKVATLLWFKSEKVRHMKRLEHCILLEELHTLDELETLIFRQFTALNESRHPLPVLVKLMRLYYVIMSVPDGRGNKQCRLFKSAFFVEAYFVWLAMCVRLEVIKEVHLQSSTVSLVSHFNKLIQF